MQQIMKLIYFIVVLLIFYGIFIEIKNIIKDYKNNER